MPLSLATFYDRLKSGSLDYTLSSRLVFSVGFSIPPAVAGANGPPEGLLEFVVRSVSVPNLSVNDGHEIISNPRGKYILPKSTGYTPSENTMKIVFIETEFPFIERWIEPWYMHNASIKNRVARSNIMIRIYNANPTAGMQEIASYGVNGAYPEFLDMPELDHTRTDLKTRSVVFAFNEMVPLLKDIDTINKKLNPPDDKKKAPGRVKRRRPEGRINGVPVSELAEMEGYEYLKAKPNTINGKPVKNTKNEKNTINGRPVGEYEYLRRKSKGTIEVSMSRVSE